MSRLRNSYMAKQDRPLSARTETVDVKESRGMTLKYSERVQTERALAFISSAKPKFGME
jgi:hypothetical protein